MEAWCSGCGIHGLLSLGPCPRNLAQGSQQSQLQSLWPGTTFLGVSTAGSRSSGSSGQCRGPCTTILSVMIPFNLNSNVSAGSPPQVV